MILLDKKKTQSVASSWSIWAAGPQVNCTLTPRGAALSVEEYLIDGVKLQLEGLADPIKATYEIYSCIYSL